MAAQIKEEGWLPQHVLVREEGSGELLGAVPLYLKSHSYGGAHHCKAAVPICGLLATPGVSKP